MSTRILLALVLAALTAGGASARTITGESATIARGEVVEENLYVTSTSVNIHGIVKGDVVIGANDVTIDGEVLGDVLVGAADVTITGSVKGDVRGFAGDVTISGPVGGDVMMSGARINIGSPVGGAVYAGAGYVTIEGPVAGDVAIAGGTVNVNAPIGGDAIVRSGTFTLGENARIAGGLNYEGETAITRAPGATVAGKVIEKEVEADTGLAWPIKWARSLVGYFLLGVLWLAFFRRFVGSAGKVLRVRPAASLGVGFLLTVATPVALGIVFVVGTMVGGWWLSAMGLSIYMMGLALAMPLVAIIIGNEVGTRFNVKWLQKTWVSLLLPLAVLLLVTSIPYVGGLIGFFVSAIGFGAVAIAMKEDTLEHTRVEYREA